MRMLESEAKEAFRKWGIETPRSVAFSTVAELDSAYKELGGEVVIKPMGIKGRGKAGLIKFANTAEEARKRFEELEVATSVSKNQIGYIVEEKAKGISKEFYIAISVDYKNATPTLVLSNKGGVDVEEIARSSPASIKRLAVDITAGLNEADVSKLIRELNMPEGIMATARNVYDVFREYDAETVEINPLALTDSGKLLALDAVLVINDDSIFKHPELIEEYKSRKYKTPLEREMGELGWSYVELDGNIGIISSGAGLSMATMDLIKAFGGNPANFLDMAQVDGEGIYKGLKLVAAKPGVKVIFINLIAGLNRCDMMAEGVKHFVAENGVSVPVIARMVGNRSEDGAEILKQAGLKNIEKLEDSVQAVVEAANAR